MAPTNNRDALSSFRQAKKGKHELEEVEEGEIVEDHPAKKITPTKPSAWTAGSVASGAMRSVMAAPSNEAKKTMAANSISRSKVCSGSVAPECSKFGSVLKKSEYHAGQIISALHAERDGLQIYEPNNAHQSVTNEGTLIYEKERKFVVIRVFATHALVLPIYTYKGKGLEKKEHRNHYISIREYDDMENAAPAENNHPILWADALAELKANSSPWYKMSNSASVHFTSPIVHKFSNPTKVMAKLTIESLNILRKVYNAAFNEDEYNEETNPTPEQEVFVPKFNPLQANWSRGNQGRLSEVGKPNNWRAPGRSTVGWRK